MFVPYPCPPLSPLGYSICNINDSCDLTQLDTARPGYCVRVLESSSTRREYLLYTLNGQYPTWLLPGVQRDYRHALRPVLDPHMSEEVYWYGSIYPLHGGFFPFSTINTYYRANSMQDQNRRIGRNNSHGLSRSTTSYTEWLPDFRHGSAVWQGVLDS